MGWYTELKIGKESWSWRKDLPPIVPLIFYGDNSIKGLEFIDTCENYNEKFIGFNISVKRAISNLNKLGITLDFLTAIYARYRPGFAYQNKMMLEVSKDIAKKFGKTKFNIRNEQYIKRIEDSNAVKDISAVVSVLREDRIIETALVSVYDGVPFIPSIMVIKNRDELSQENILEACTFGSFIEYAKEQLPEIYQLFEWRLLMEASANNSRVKLNLAEWIYEGGDINTVIPESIKELSEKVLSYSKTFDTLIGGDKTIKIEYSRKKIIGDWKTSKERIKNNYEKGRRLENFTATLIDSIDGLSIIEKNLKSDLEELDLVVKNNIQSPFIQSINSPILLVECKNWTNPVGIEEARVFESKIRELGQRANLGIFVALNGVTAPFKKHLNNLKRENYTILVLTNKEIEELTVSYNLDANEWIESLISNQMIIRD
jgi:Holliday junction resolvase-like predicted endonuclease